MANQDLLFNVIPRAPATPGSGDFGKELSQVQREQALKQVEIHKDPKERAPQDEYHPSKESHQEPQDEPEARDPSSGNKTNDDDEHVDLYI